MKKKKVFTCLGCNITFKTSTSYIDHLDGRPVCQQKSHKCDICNSIFASKKSLEYHQRHNKSCINLADRVSKVGHEFETVRPSPNKKQRVSESQMSEVKIAFKQTSAPSTVTTTYSNSANANRDLQYTIPEDIPVDNNISISPQKIQSHIAYLKRQFPLGLLNSLSFERSVFIMKIIKLKREWMNRSLRGTMNALVHEIQNHIFKTKMISGKQSISGYSHPFTFDSISDEELRWFVNYHNTQFIDSIDQYSPDIYQTADNPPQEEHDTINESQDFEMTDDAPDTSEMAPSENNQNQDDCTIDSTVEELVYSAKLKRSNMHVDYEDLMLLELFDVLREAGAPMYVFDKIAEWGHRNSKQLSYRKPLTRELFFKRISSKTYGQSLSRALKPIHEKHHMPSNGASIGLTRFSFRAKLATLLLDDDLMSPENLLLNLDDPTTPLNDEGENVLDDLNTGWWHKETTTEVCKNKGEILLPIIFFIDAGKVTQRQSVEPITFTLGIFNRLTRNRSEAWRTLGYLENLNNSKKSQQKKYNSKMKLKDYHYMLSVILKEFKSLQGKDNGLSFKLTLAGKTYDVIFKLAVQTIMGDCMGLDKLCLFYGSNSLETSRMCRDCDVPPLSSDDPDYQCRFTKISDLVGLCKNGFKAMSIHNLTNAVKDIYFGARKMCIYQCTPGEPLHAILLGLIKYEYEVFEGNIPKKTLRLINEIVKYYYCNFSRQSFRNMPSLAPFLGGIDNCDMLGGKEQYARLFGIYLAMNNREVIHSLCTQPRHRYDEKEKRSVQVKPMSLEEAVDWYNLIESTLIMYQWVMLPSHNKSDLVPVGNNDDSKGQSAIRAFMHQYKALVKNRGGHGVKLLKFHQLLHYNKEILKDGSIQNIDTGRCESIAVTMYKRISIWTQRRQMLLTEQLAARHLECVTAIELGRTLSKCDFAKDRSFVIVAPKQSVGLGGSTFKMKLTNCQDNEFSYLNKTVAIEWKGVPVDASYHSYVFKNLTKRLYLNTEDGGCLTHDSVVVGKTEYADDDGNVYRAHPNYRSNGMWYDWCKISWNTTDDPVPARIIMFLDLTECKLMDHTSLNQMREDLNEEIMEVTEDGTRRRYPNRDRTKYLSKDDIWVVIRSAYDYDHSTATVPDLTQSEKQFTMNSKLTHRIILEDECRIVPVSSIISPCYVLPGTFSDSRELCSEFFVVDDIDKWGHEFLA